MIGNQNTPLSVNQGPRLAVRFLSRWQNYWRGDVACFPARMAAQLVGRHIAERVNIAPADQMPPEGAEFAIRPPGEWPMRKGVEDDLDL